MGWAYHFRYFVLLEAWPAWLAKAPTSYLAWPVCPAPLAFPVSKRGIGAKLASSTHFNNGYQMKVAYIHIHVHMYCICVQVRMCANPPVKLSWHFYTHTQPSLFNNPAGTSAESVFPPIFFCVLFAFGKQDESTDGSIQRSFIFRRRAISKTQQFIQYKHILVQRALV